MSKQNLDIRGLKDYQEMVNTALDHYLTTSQNGRLYEPINYLLQIGGKRIRPALVLATADACNGSVSNALPVALAIEVFHNFTLMHDDIMDDAPLRRGFETVHEKWGTNAAILSGDTMLVQAYQLLAQSDPHQLPELLNVFSQAAVEVCEGQQLDMEFESRSDVHIDEYLEMIRLKTSVLLAAALRSGAIVAGADQDTASHLYAFGEQIGVAFQLRDDYLDAFGDTAKFGKQVGGDILADKKTYLWIRAHELANEEQKAELKMALSTTPTDAGKINAYLNFFENTGAKAELQSAMNQHVDEAMEHLEKAQLNTAGRKTLREFIALIIHREV